MSTDDNRASVDDGATTPEQGPSVNKGDHSRKVFEVHEAKPGKLTLGRCLKIVEEGSDNPQYEDAARLLAELNKALAEIMEPVYGRLAKFASGVLSIATPSLSAPQQRAEGPARTLDRFDLDKFDVRYPEPLDVDVPLNPAFETNNKLTIVAEALDRLIASEKATARVDFWLTAAVLVVSVVGVAIALYFGFRG